MRELLYIPEMEPPEQVLHHAILYRDCVSTLVPDEPEKYLSTRTKLALDAEVYRPRLVGDLWSDRRVLERSIHAFLFRRGPGEERVCGWTADAEQILEAQSSSLAMPMDARAEIWEDWAGRPQPCDEEKWRRRGIMRIHLGYSNLPNWAVVATAGTAVALLERARRDSSLPLVVPCYPPSVAAVMRDFGFTRRSDHLLARIDVGRFLPEVPSGIDTATVIAFRNRYSDERRRLIRAVERLVKDAARAYGQGELADIERDVREELDQALEDMKQAGQHIFRGWVRRAAWFTIASSAGAAVAGPLGAAAGSVAANWASNVISDGVRRNEFSYLYRIQAEVDDFNSMAT